MLGERIRSIRTSLGLTVGALAERTGLSKGLISQVETGKTSPSIANLERLAGGLGVPAAYLLLRPEQKIQVVRKCERAEYHFGPHNLKLQVLSGCASRNLKAVLVEFPPGTCTGSDLHAHRGEEFHLVLEGRIEAQQGDEVVRLEAGDTFHWTGCIPHQVRNVGDTVARVLAVTSATMLESVGEESDIE